MHYFYIYCIYIRILVPLKQNYKVTYMRIKEAIKEKGLTVAVVAQRMGVDSPALSRVIHGNPTIEMLERVAAAIGIHVTELFDKPTVSGGFVCPKCGAHLKVYVDAPEHSM